MSIRLVSLDENAHPCGTQPVSKDATTNPSGRVEVLEAELKNALEQVKHFRDRISRARALHSIVEGTETFVTTTAGSWNSFLIIAYDEIGQPCTEGGDEFKVICSGAGPKEVIVDDHGDGTYTARICVTQTGDYSIQVLLSGTSAIQFEPHCMKVEAAAPAPKSCQAAGPGLSSIEAGYATNFEINCFDRFGNVATIPAGEEPFRIKIEVLGGSNFDLEPVTLEGPGAYLCNYIVRDRAAWEVSVKIDGEHIHNSPFVPGFDPGATDPAQCHVISECFEQDVVAGSAWDVTLIARDTYGNTRVFGGDEVAVSVETPDGSVQELTNGSGIGCWWDNDDGTYTAQLQFLKIGEYRVHMSIRGRLAGTSHKRVYVVAAEPEPGQFFAVLDGLASCVAGQPMHLTIEGRDRFGNASDISTDELLVELKCASAIVKGDVIPIIGSKHKCEVALMCSVADEYNLSTTYGGSIVTHASEHLVSVFANVTEPSMCDVFADEQSKRVCSTTNGLQQACIGIPAQFYVRTMDAYGNHCTSGGDNVKVSVTPLEGSASLVPCGVHVQDLGDGTYRCTYMACQACKHNIQISINNETIPISAEVEVLQSLPKM